MTEVIIKLPILYSEGRIMMNRILIVDDDALSRDKLRSLIDFKKMRIHDRWRSEKWKRSQRA